VIEAIGVEHKETTRYVTFLCVYRFCYYSIAITRLLCLHTIFVFSFYYKELWYSCSSLFRYLEIYEWRLRLCLTNEILEAKYITFLFRLL